MHNLDKVSCFPKKCPFLLLNVLISLALTVESIIIGVFFSGIELLLEEKVEKSSDFHLKLAFVTLSVIKKVSGY